MLSIGCLDAHLYFSLSSKKGILKPWAIIKIFKCYRYRCVIISWKKILISDPDPKSSQRIRIPNLQIMADPDPQHYLDVRERRERLGKELA
jgi:hypothetical protein